MKKSAMKGMKRKAMKKSVIAKGKRGKASAFAGKKAKTASGIKKTDLHKNKRGKIVTKKSSAAGKKAYKNISAWTAACRKARTALKIKGFVPIGGKSAAGKAFLAKAKSFFKK